MEKRPGLYGRKTTLASISTEDAPAHMWAHREDFSLYRLENKLHGTGNDILGF
jgi:hypothetical protein